MSGDPQLQVVVVAAGEDFDATVVAGATTLTFTVRSDAELAAELMVHDIWPSPGDAVDISGLSEEQKRRFCADQYQTHWTR